MSVTSPAHENDPRQSAIPDTHGHAKGEHKPFAEERPIPYSARMLFLWFYHACRRGYPRYLMVADHMNSLTFEDPAAVHAVRRAIKHAEAGDLYGAAEIANVEIGHAQVVHEGITRRGMRYSIGAEVDNDPRSRPDAQNIVDAMRPDATIRSIHFLTIPHPQTGAEFQWPFDNPEFASFYDAVGVDRVWELYMEQLIDAIEKLPGNIIGHFYVPAKFGHWPAPETLEAHEDRFVAACAEHGKAIELNTRFFYRYADTDEKREAFTAAFLRLLKKAKAAGVGISVGSDAHSPKDQGAGFDEALRLLDAAEINELVFPIGGRLRQVALRVSAREVEPEPAPRRPEPSGDAPSMPTLETASATAEDGTAKPDAAVDGDAASAEELVRPKRVSSKRPSGASSKRTTPGPEKGAPRGEHRTPESPATGRAAEAAAPGETPAAETASVEPPSVEAEASASRDGVAESPASPNAPAAADSGTAIEAASSVKPDAKAAVTRSTRSKRPLPPIAEEAPPRPDEAAASAGPATNDAASASAAIDGAGPASEGLAPVDRIEPPVSAATSEGTSRTTAPKAKTAAKVSAPAGRVPKSSTSAANDARSSASEAAAVKSSVAKAGVAQASPAKPSASKPSPAKPGASKPSPVKASAPKASAVKASAPKAGVAKASAQKAGAAKVSAAKTSVPKTRSAKGESKASGKPAAAKASVPKGAGKTTAPKAVVGKPATPKSGANAKSAKAASSKKPAPKTSASTIRRGSSGGSRATGASAKSSAKKKPRR